MKLKLLLVALLMTAGPAFAGQIDFDGWIVYDDPTVYQTDLEPTRQVTHHGDRDLYFYEPSGIMTAYYEETVRGEAFYELQSFIINNAQVQWGQPSFSFDTTQTDLEPFHQATYTYATTSFYLPKGYQGTVMLKIGPVDDGLLAMCNGEIVGLKKLSSDTKIFNLNQAADGYEGVLRLGRNDIILILVDDARYVKRLQGLELMGGTYSEKPSETVVDDSIEFVPSATYEGLQIGTEKLQISKIGHIKPFNQPKPEQKVQKR